MQARLLVQQNDCCGLVVQGRKSVACDAQLDFAILSDPSNAETEK